MNENFKQSLSELKEIVLRLHRWAGDLDSLILSIESETRNKVGFDKYFMRCFVVTQFNYRESRKQAEFANLDREEQEIWKKLIEATKQ